MIGRDEVGDRHALREDFFGEVRAVDAVTDRVDSGAGALVIRVRGRAASARVTPPGQLSGWLGRLCR